MPIHSVDFDSRGGIVKPVQGKPAERQGRKVSGLKGKTYDSGAAG